MIVCHCNCIQAAAIERSARELCAESSGTPTPEEVYGALGMKPCCGDCLPLAEAIISSTLPMSALPMSGLPSPASVPAVDAEMAPILIAAE